MAAEGLDEWEHLSPSPSPPASPKWHCSLLVRDDYLGEQSAFHPSLHEDLNLDPLPPPQPSPLLSEDYVDVDDEEEEEVPPIENEASEEDGFGEVSPSSCSVLGEINRFVRSGSSLSWGCASAVAAGGIIVVVVGASLAYSKLQKLKLSRRKRSGGAEESAALQNLILLVKQKEERINQLMIQIDKMNQAVLAQRRVRVLRVA